MEHMADTVASIDYLQLSQTNARLWPILAHVAHAHKPQLLHLCHCTVDSQYKISQYVHGVRSTSAFVTDSPDAVFVGCLLIFLVAVRRFPWT